MTRLIIFGFLILVWIIIQIFRIREFKQATAPKPVKVNRPRHPVAPEGKKYSWAWMQTAGAFQLKFIRPEESNGFPAIKGQINGIKVMIQCMPGNAGKGAAAVFRFHFPEPAGIGLTLLLAQNPKEVQKFASGRKSAVLPNILKERQLPAYFLQLDDPECFQRCFSARCMDHLQRLSLIYPKIMLTDNDLMVSSTGISDDPQGFRMQLNTLLKITETFSGFVAAAARSKVVQQTEPLQTETKNSPEPAHAETTPDSKVEPPAIREETAPAAANPLEKSVFLRMLWSRNQSAQRQKEIFAASQNMEIEWDGVLKTCYPYSSDFTFGQGGGIKATFELDEFKPEGGFLPIKIKAVASFPNDSEKIFAHAYGKTFRFRGKLLKIEPIAKEIYLSDGSITGVES